MLRADVPRVKTCVLRSSSRPSTCVDDNTVLAGIRLKLDADPRLGEFVGDDRKIKQVLLSLLSNAVKFTPEGGRICLTARLRDGVVEISVSDTGIGIARKTSRRSSRSSARSGATRRTNRRAPGSAWRSDGSSWRCTAAGSGWTARWPKLHVHLHAAGKR